MQKTPRLPTKTPRKRGENSRNYKGEVRLSLEEKTVLIQKSNLYHNGNESMFVREAILNYRPIKKVDVV